MHGGEGAASFSSSISHQITKILKPQLQRLSGHQIQLWLHWTEVFEYVAVEQNHPNKLTACQLNKAVEKSFIHTKNSAVQSENKLLQRL